jgi:hypothetical protein
MTEVTQGRQRKRMWLWLTLAALVVILAVLIVPPLVSESRYKSQITSLISASLGRPVRLSSVEVRLLPRPGFVLTDLTVDEDPEYGAEPVLHANSVTASIRLLSLWRGRLEIGRISVDEASLNLVRTATGRWNLDPLFRTAAAHALPGTGAASPRRLVELPYLEATNSRINIKNGVEKLPFSLVGTDLSLWQAEPGEWRIRLRGQPARTDVSLDLADTGIVRLEGRAHQASELRQMPLHLDLDWREAQLGQLTRLVIGSDPGWRGDLTGELHLDGTADRAQVKARLRAEGVHRAEFAPAATLDFDANCNFVSHFSVRAIENLSCESPLGDGRIRLTGELPGESGLPDISVELDRIPVAAGLDALRTVRSGLGPGLEARGTVSGKISYARNAPETGLAQKPAGQGNARPGKSRVATQGPLTGSFTVEGFQLSGDGLSTPIQAPRLVLEPVPIVQGRSSQPSALAATVAIPAGGAGPLTVTARLALSGYQITVRGQASIARARELARISGMAGAAALDAVAGEPLSVNLSAQGPWLPAERIPFSQVSPGGVLAGAGGSLASSVAAGDSLRGDVTLHNANWKADFLANHVEISQATLHLGDGDMRWDPVIFSYGPVKGTASLSVPAVCDPPQPCSPTFQVQFGDLDASTLQAAVLGARAPGTLISTLIARLHPSSAPAWPSIGGTVKANSLILGPVTLSDATATLNIQQNGAEITGLDANLLGGTVHGAGTLRTPGPGRDRPAYTLEGHFEKLSPAAVGQLLGLRCSGGALNGDGKIDLSGFTDKDLAASVKGALHFEWRHGAIGAQGAQSHAAPVPPALVRFDRWTADTGIANGAVTLKQNEVQQGASRRAVEATVTLGDPPRVIFGSPKEATRAKR